MIGYQLDDGVGMAALAAEPAAGPAGGADVLEILLAATEAARRYERVDLVARLERERSAVLEPQCRVLVIGEFKKGKSSLVNALLNARICATDAQVATAVPTMVRYGAEVVATVLADGGVAAQQGRQISLADVEGLATGADLGGGDPAGRRSAVHALDVTLPRELLRDGLVLVDTPGVGGGLASAHAAATLRALTSADALLFVSDAGGEYTAPELEFLRQAVDLCPTVICALTKIDFYPEWRRILATDQSHLRRAGLKYEIVPLSAPLRLHGLQDGDKALLAESGYPRLAALLRQATAATADTARAAGAAAAHATLAQLVSRLSTEHDALADPARASEQRAQWTEARQRAERLKSGGSRWQQVLTDRIGDLAANVDLDLGVRLRALRKEAADQIGPDNPLLGWAQLEPWLHRRTNEALLDHLRTIRDQADDVANDVAQEFGLAAWELRVAVDVEGQGGAAADVGLAAVATNRSSRFELGLMAARGGSVGLIVGHAAGLVLGLALPVTLPVTALLSSVLARKTWRSARTSQLRALRAEAERAIAVYLDEVELVARKDSRDSVRQVQRQLREVFGQRAGELYAATAQNLEVLTKAVQEDERGRRSRLAETTVELERLRALAARAGGLVDGLLAAPAGAGARPALRPPQ
jgi:Dynamin family